MERAIVVEAIHGLPFSIARKEIAELLKVVDPQLSAFYEDVPQDGTFACLYVSKKRYVEWKKADKKGTFPRSLIGVVIDFFLKLAIRWPTQLTFKMMAGMVLWANQCGTEPEWKEELMKAIKTEWKRKMQSVGECEMIERLPEDPRLLARMRPDIYEEVFGTFAVRKDDDNCWLTSPWPTKYWRLTLLLLVDMVTAPNKTRLPADEPVNKKPRLNQNAVTTGPDSEVKDENLSTDSTATASDMSLPWSVQWCIDHGRALHDAATSKGPGVEFRAVRVRTSGKGNTPPALREKAKGNSSP